MKCYMSSVLLYDEKHELVEGERRYKILSFEMRICKRVDRTKWIAGVSNEEVLIRVKEN